ncbi:MAG: hypothetical protein Q4A16_04000 [Lautropia sp.]|nr:hypothetical protein [Lautropia sp.]
MNSHSSENSTSPRLRLKRSDGKTLTLGRQLGAGGEGVVNQVINLKGYAVKRYLDDDPAKLAEKARKIEAMVRAGLARNEHESLSFAAFPVDTVHTPHGEFAGFLMRVFDRRWQLHEVFSPLFFREQHEDFPQYDYRFLVCVATNIARAVANIHATGCVIGDMNASGMLISDDGTVALVDADSFQFDTGREAFFCEVGQIEYTPPELQGQSFKGVYRDRRHDAFGLAVLLFQTLMLGRHPFMGVPEVGEVPSVGESIRRRQYAYAENRRTGLRPPQGYPRISAFSGELAGLFSQAFDAEEGDPRPDAACWVEALERYEKSLRRCRRYGRHYYPRTIGHCPWCEMKTTSGFDPFSTVDPHVTIPQIRTSASQARPRFFEQQKYSVGRRSWPVRLLSGILKLLFLPVMLLVKLLGVVIPFRLARVPEPANGHGFIRRSALFLTRALVLLLVCVGLWHWASLRYPAVPPVQQVVAPVLREADRLYRQSPARRELQVWARTWWPASWTLDTGEGETVGRRAVKGSGKDAVTRRTDATMGRKGEATTGRDDGSRMENPPAGASAADRAAARPARAVTITDKVMAMQRVLQQHGYPVRTTGSFDRDTRSFATDYLQRTTGEMVRESQSVHEFYEAFMAQESRRPRPWASGGR